MQRGWASARVGLEELIAERCIAVDHVTVCRWVRRFTPEFIGPARIAESRGLRQELPAQ
jgi:transposase-like protein